MYAHFFVQTLIYRNFKTKGRGEVAGSTRKIYKQKGTGNARAGSVRATQRKGSGAAHGPHPKDWSFKLNKKVRRLAMLSVLSAKFAQGNLTIFKDLDIESHKTKFMFETAQKLNWNEGGVFVLDGKKSKNFEMATSNLKIIYYSTVLNVYEILKKKNLIITKSGLENLQRHKIK